MFQPEGGVDEWVVLGRCHRIEPDAEEAVRRLQVWPGEIELIVEYYPAAHRWPINNEHRGKNQCETDQLGVSAPFGVGRFSAAATLQNVLGGFRHLGTGDAPAR